MATGFAYVCIFSECFLKTTKIDFFKAPLVLDKSHQMLISNNKQEYLVEKKEPDGNP